MTITMAEGVSEMSLVYFVPLGVAITAVAAGVGLVWYLSAHELPWVREEQRVRCPENGEDVQIEVVRRPDYWELLVTSDAPEHVCVSRCSRFGTKKVTCAQGCLPKSS
ncbi:MAG: hypothetical protein AMXMBFR33_08350 [Candidatus Xenobia bacterium]